MWELRADGCCGLLQQWRYKLSWVFFLLNTLVLKSLHDPESYKSLTEEYSSLLVSAHRLVLKPCLTVRGGCTVAVCAALSVHRWPQHLCGICEAHCLTSCLGWGMCETQACRKDCGQVSHISPCIDCPPYSTSWWESHRGVYHSRTTMDCTLVLSYCLCIALLSATVHLSHQLIMTLPWLCIHESLLSLVFWAGVCLSIGIRAFNHLLVSASWATTPQHFLFRKGRIHEYWWWWVKGFRLLNGILT